MKPERPSRLAVEDSDLARHAVLEEVADRLLAARAGSQEAYSFYTERALRRQLGRDEWHPVLEVETLPRLPAIQLALRMLTRTNIAPHRRLAFRLLARNHQQQEVARSLGVSPAQLRRWMVEVCQELREQLRHPQEGLLLPRQEIREAFREDMDRHAPEEERHCRHGQEACRRTGQCVCRWYLHYLSD